MSKLWYLYSKKFHHLLCTCDSMTYAIPEIFCRGSIVLKLYHNWNQQLTDWPSQPPPPPSSQCSQCWQPGPLGRSPARRPAPTLPERLRLLLLLLPFISTGDCHPFIYRGDYHPFISGDRPQPIYFKRLVSSILYPEVIAYHPSFFGDLHHPLIQRSCVTYLK